MLYRFLERKGFTYLSGKIFKAEHAGSDKTFDELMDEYATEQIIKEDICHCLACYELFDRQRQIHLSDCALHNEPAERNGKCNCKPLSI